MVIFVIKEIRLEKGITLQKLSKKTGLSIKYIWRLENNLNKNPRINDLWLIADALGVNIKKIFFSHADIEIIRKQLHRYISKYGLTHPKVLNYSRIIDTLLNAKNDK